MWRDATNEIVRIYLYGLVASLRENFDEWIKMTSSYHSSLSRLVSLAQTVHCFNADQNQLFHLHHDEHTYQQNNTHVARFIAWCCHLVNSVA